MANGSLSAPNFYNNVTAQHGAMHITIAVKIARRFQRRAPTIRELMDEFGMHRSTAWRWRRAFLDAGAGDGA